MLVNAVYYDRYIRGGRGGYLDRVEADGVEGGGVVGQGQGQRLLQQLQHQTLLGHLLIELQHLALLAVL